MFRTKVGILAIVLLAAGVALEFFPDGGAEATAWASGCRRVGLLMAVLWMALPDLQRLPPWYAAVAIALLVVMVRFPRFLVGAVVVGVLILFLRPRVRAPDGTKRKPG